MSDLRNYSKQFLTEFIELYQCFTCLWKVKSKEYSNREVRNKAYEKMVDKLKEIEPNANKDMVVKKINSLRTAFRRELKKVRDSKTSGAGADQIYEPHLWYFNLLLFTEDQEIPREGSDNMANDEINIDEENIIESESSDKENEYTPIKKTPVNKKRKIESLTTSAVIEKACQILNQPDDEFTTFGNNVAQQLKKMNRTQQIFVKKIINETLFFGEMEQITIECATNFSNFMQLNFSNSLSNPPSISNSSTSAQSAENMQLN